MGITRRPDTKSADDFINAAPDASAPKPTSKPAKTNRVKGNQVAITFTLPPELLAKINDTADSLSISRAAFIKQALTRAVVAEGN
jgi:hypothetical protein